MKKIISLMIAITFCLQAAAADVQELFGMAAYYQFKTSDAASVIPAFNAFGASECRKKLPAQLRVMSEHFNGTDEATHTVIYGFASPEDMQRTYQIQGTCPEFARLWSVLSKHTTQTSQSFGQLIAAGGDPLKDRVYQIWQMKITDEAKYLREYNKLMAAMEKKGLINGAWGLVRIAAGNDRNYTHFAFSGSPSLAAHVTPQDNSLYIKFIQSVADIREIHRTNMNFVTADY